MSIDVDAEFSPQVTVTVPVPGFVFPEIVHCHETLPELSARFVLRP